MKRAVMGLLFGLLLLGGGAVLMAWSLWVGSFPASTTGSQSMLLEIPPGMTLAAAADTLVSRGLLRDRKILLLGARLSHQDRGLRAGLYRLPVGLSPQEILNNLTSGKTVQVPVTIVEGLDAEETAAILVTALELDGERFLARADSLVRIRAQRGDLLPSGLSPAGFDSLLTVASLTGNRRYHWCEGYLAPDTYLFSVGTQAETAAAHLVETQLARLDSIVASTSQKNAVWNSPHQLLVLASIVEAEAKKDVERPLIAAVYSNRLRKNWRLEADPTVAFILRKKGKRMFFKDLEVDSPYNAYRRRGLPPGPIGNPGMASLKAAGHPDTLCEALYFVSDGAGGHVFSKTAKEHEAAVQSFRKKRAANRR